MDIKSILNKWFVFSGYNPEQKRWNILSSEYTYHKANEMVEKLISEYDPTGTISIMYVKRVFLKEMENSSISLFSLLSDPSCVDKYKEAWDVFHSPEVKDIEDKYLSLLYKIIERVGGKNLIADKETEDKEKELLFNSIEGVITEIEKLKFEAYQYGGELKPIKNYPTKILVYPSLAHCVTSLETANDGMYLCYIKQGDSADGYFGFFVKNNGNIFSVNERIDEAFPGEHGGRRNARWTDAKAYNLFPYGIFDFKDHDYKGYSTTHKINESKLDIFSLYADDYYRIIIAIMLLASKYSKEIPQDKLVFIDSLLKPNYEQAKAKDNSSNALIPFTSSAIVKRNLELNIDFTTEDVVAGTLNKKFNYTDNKDAHYLERGTFPEVNEGSYIDNYIKLYSEGFELDKNSILKSDSYKNLLPGSVLENTNSKDYPVEFVGNEKRFEMEAYRQARLQLAEHINENMVKAYVEFGGCAAANKWWKTAIAKRKEFIEELCVKLYLENNVDNIEPPGGYRASGWSFEKSVTLKNDFMATVECYPDTRGLKPTYGFYLNNDYNEMDEWRGKSVNCDYTGNKASVYFTFRAKNYKSVEYLLGTEVPEILKGWGCRDDIYTGNSLLSATDAVCNIINPFDAVSRHYSESKRYSEYQLGSRVNFYFNIAFSKKGFKELIKKYSK